MPAGLSTKMKLTMMQLCRTFHLSMLHRAYDNGAGVQRPSIIVIEDEEECEVQEILNHNPAYKTRSIPTYVTLCSEKAMVLLTTVGNQPAP